MTVNLAKGANTSLTDPAKGGVPNLDKVDFGLGWDVRTTTGAQFDLDAKAIIGGPDGKLTGADNFVFYNNLRSPSGAVEHGGDNLTGEGAGPDEVITVSLAGLQPGEDTVTFLVDIYDAEARGDQKMGQVNNAFIEVSDPATGDVLVRYDLTEDYSTDAVLVVGQLYRRDGGWKFKAIGQGYPDSKKLAEDFNIPV